MPRCTLLVAEPEPSQTLSVRKLVLESGKFNVLTAHSTREAIDLLRLFPNISATVLVGSESIDCDEVAKHIKNASNKVPVIFLKPKLALSVMVPTTALPVMNRKDCWTIFARSLAILAPKTLANNTSVRHKRSGRDRDSGLFAVSWSAKIFRCRSPQEKISEDRQQHAMNREFLYGMKRADNHMKSNPG